MHFFDYLIGNMDGGVYNTIVSRTDPQQWFVIDHAWSFSGPGGGGTSEITVPESGNIFLN